MRTRGLLALVAIAAIAVGGSALGSVHERPAVSAAATGAHSGSWFCPHGGGAGWQLELAVTNPGPNPVPIRVSTFAKAGPLAPRRISVPAETVVRVPVKGDSRGAASQVEYFGGWVGVSWLAQAGGNESGIASEPCSPALGRTWLMPDGTCVRGEDGWVVVMNPTNAVAQFSLRLETEEQTILTGDWADFVLRPHRSTALHLNQKAEGRQTVAADLRVSIGRVAAAMLGASHNGGIRAELGARAPERTAILPGGPEAGRTELIVDDVGTHRASYRGSLARTDGTQALGQFRGESLQPGQARTYDLSTERDSTIQLQLVSGDGVASARRSFGPGGDQGSTSGAAPAAAWAIAAGTFSSKDEWRLVLTNPGVTQAVVKLWLVSAGGISEKLSPRSITISPGRTRPVAADFTLAARLGSVIAVATDGTFVPLAASYTGTGSGYATAVGVPIPPRWVPERFS
jgi:hypothetical protein